MDVKQLLSAEFSVSDSLDAALKERLGAAAVLLDTRAPWPKDESEQSRQTFLREEQARRQRFLEAKERALGLLEPSGYDLRVLTVLLRAEAELGHSQGCLFALQMVSAILGERWDELLTRDAELSERARSQALGRRTRYFASLFEQVQLKLARDRASDSGGVTETLVGGGGDWGRLRTELDQRIEARGLYCKEWQQLQDLLQQLAIDSTPVASAAAEPSADGGQSGQPEPSPSPVTAIDVESRSDKAGDDERRDSLEVTLRVSSRFVELERRLQAFQQLVREHQYEKASLVAADLQATLERFDVSAYFPTLFAGYFVGLAEHASGLTPFVERPEDARFRALLGLYRSDLRRFLEVPEGEPFR